MNKIYIDCGSYRGSTIRLFSKSSEYTSDFQIYSIEAVKSKLDSQRTTLKDLNVNYINAAVWIYDGEIDFRLSSRRKGLADGLFKNRLASKEDIIKVPCLDFSSWCSNNFHSDDFIIIKMDIEGAEVEVLKKMIDDNSIALVKILYLETHGKRRLDKRQDIKRLYQELKNIKALDLRDSIESYKKGK